jgi:amidophosphoribosyltransferase
MSRMRDFVAFRAVVELLRQRDMEYVLDQVYDQCIANPDAEENFVKAIYEPFSDQEISDKIAEIITSESIEAEVHVIYQTVQNLHLSCPAHRGDWYFTGDFPTEGGMRVVNKAFVNYMEGKVIRAY